MGWLKRFFDKLGSQAPANVRCIQIYPQSDAAGEIVPDKHYIELYLRAARLESARKFTTKFQGVVYSFATINRDGEAKSKYAAVSKPENLLSLDKNSLSKTIPINLRLMGPAPWRGGGMDLELGLFSIKSGEILTPIVDYVTKVAAAAGISYAAAIKPFVGLITEGMDLITGQSTDTAIEVGVDTTLPLTTEGLFALIDAKDLDISPEDLSVDQINGKLTYKGAELKSSWCLFAIIRQDRKDDWGEIPELKEAWDEIESAIKRNKPNEAKEALAHFRRVAQVCPDLIEADATRLADRAKQKFDAAFPGGIALAATNSTLGPLWALDLYGDDGEG